MTQTAAIKVITEGELEELARPKPAGRKGRQSSKSSASSGEFIARVRDRARPIEELAGTVSELETPVILLFDATVGAEALDLFATLVRSIATDRTRFGRLVDALMPAEDVSSGAAVEQARRNASARAAFLHEFPTLSSAQVADLYGSAARNRAALAQSWRKQGRVFSVPVAGGQRFPLFQFTEGAEPKPTLAEVIAPLRAAGLEGWQIALWFAGALASLGGKRPVDLLDTEPARVVEAATRVGEVPQ